MKTTKRLISIVLLLTLLVGMVPTAAQAEEVQTSVGNGNTTIEGTNGFGTLLSEDIQEQQDVQEEAYAGGYNIIDLTIEDGVAVVEYDTLEKANLVVSLYTEDGLQLLVSGNQLVQPEETEAVIILEGEIPEYFMASAYLLDTYDYSPLCDSYSTPMYTKEMQDLLASTTDDYDADKVLNLDDDKTTNFAVYADTTKVLEYKEGVNTVITANDETATYVIGNADANITGLQTGDVLAYAYGEDQILIVKVASVNLNGTTATITGTDLEMEEVFSHVKLENVSDASDVVVDESSIGEGVTFDGLTQEGARTYALRDLQGDGSVKNSLNYTVDQKVEETHDEVTVSVSLKGTLGMELNIEFSYYVTLAKQFMKFETDVGVKMAVSLSGEVEVAIPLGDISVMFFGVSIGFEPSFNIEVEGKVEISCFVGFTIGYIYDSQIGLLYRDTTPKVEFDSKIEASIFLGIDLNPKIDVLKGALAKAELNAPIGLELKAELSDDSTEDSAIDSETIHGCEYCVEMELNFKIELSAKISFLKIEDLTLKTKVKAVEAQIATFYWSLDHSEFGVGDCPYKKYRVTVQVKDGEEKAVSNINVDAALAESDQRTYLGKTNKNGIVVHYLQVGTYTFIATVDGKELSKDITIEEACKVTLDKASTGGKPSFISKIDKDSITDSGTIIASGECGADSDNVTWILDSSGTLKIQGTGAMKNYYRPWSDYKNQIISVIITNGVTTIGDGVFYYCPNLSSVTVGNSVITVGGGAFESCESLTSVTLGNSVTTIGYSAFHGCNSLSSIAIPDSITTIRSSAFDNCSSLNGIWVSSDNVNYSSDANGVMFNKDKTELIRAPGALSGSYTIPNSVAVVGNYAFDGCSRLTDVSISDAVTTIGYGAFDDCGSLTNVSIGGGVTTIDDYAFQWCYSLVDVTIGDSVTTIGNYAFHGCNSLSSITIPDRVTTIGDHAFDGCYILTNVTIGDGVTTVGDYAFNNCYRLTGIWVNQGNTSYSNDINGVMFNKDKTELIRAPGALSGSYTIPNSVAVVGNHAFDNCESLSNVTIGNGVTTVGKSAFAYCDNLTSVIVGNSVTTIGNYAFDHCKNLRSIVIPDSVTTIGNYAFDYCYYLENVYYSGSSTQWSKISIEGNNWYLINATIHYNSETIPAIVPALAVENIANGCEEQTIYAVSQETPVLFSVYDGEYETESRDEYALKTASFTGIIPEEQYVLLALVSIEVEEILAPDNLLYIDQETAAEDGTLVFSYVQRETTDVSYVMACGASNKNLKDAQITFPTMIASNDVQAVNPVVVYDDVTLTEGVDYVLVGAVSFATPGTYTCYIRGIYDYTGTVQCSYTVVDGNGWIQDNGCWYYYRDGEKTTGWLNLSGTYYYFNADGVMRTGWVQDGGVWYYLKSSGAMATGWQQIGSTWYYFNGSGVMLTGWQQISGKWYYFASSGAMQTGWLQLGSTWYYLHSSGAMATGTVIVDGALSKFNFSGVWQGYVSGWYQQGSNWYYAGSNGKPVTGWKAVSGTYYFFNTSGVMQTGWLQSGGTWYYLQSSGAMANGWAQDNGKWYYFNASGAMVTGWQKVGTTWYYFQSSGAMQTGWLKDGNTWYYFHSSGAMATGSVKVGNKTYNFNSSGACLNP